MSDTSLLFIRVIISILGTLLTVYLIPLLKMHLQNSQYVYLLQVVDTAVRAAEQTVKAEKSGAVKKERVVQVVTEWMNSHNIKITQEQLSEIIEWAVYTMKHEDE